MNSGNLKSGSLACLIIGVASASPLQAHHSFASHYDATRSVQLTGTVSEFRIRSPHSFLFLDSTNADGSVTRWEIEMGSVPILTRQGITSANVKAGDRITVNAWPNRVEGNPLVWGRGLVTANGVALGQFPETPSVASAYLNESGAMRIQGRWSVPPPAPLTTTVTPLSLTAAGQAYVNSYDPQQSPANICEPDNVPATYHSPYLFDIRINDGEAVIYQESYNVTRTIPLDSAPAQADAGGYFGVASGRLDNNELVVESSGYPASAWGLGRAADEIGVGTDIPSSTQKKLVERFSVSEDGQTLTINYTMEDPLYLTAPYSGSAILKRVADNEPMYTYSCELDSAQRFSRDP